MFTIISINNDASLKLSQNAGKIATASTIIALVAGILAYSLWGGPGSFLPTTPAAGYVTTGIALLFVFDAIRYTFIYKRRPPSLPVYKRRPSFLSGPASTKSESCQGEVRNRPPSVGILYEEPVISKIVLSNSEESEMTINKYEWVLRMITEQELQQMIQGKSVQTDPTSEESVITDNDPVVLTNKEMIQLMPTTGGYKGGPFFLDQTVIDSKWELHLCCRKGTRYPIRITHQHICGGSPMKLYVRQSTAGGNQYFVAWPKPQPLLSPSEHDPDLPLMTLPL